MRNFVGKYLLLLSFLMVVYILLATVFPVTASGQVFKPSPKNIQNLSDAGYYNWAVWHNSVVKQKANNYIGPSKWNYGTVTSSRIKGQINVYPRYRYDSITGNLRMSTCSRTYRYLNPEYRGPGPITIYNPFVKPASNDKLPD